MSEFQTQSQIKCYKSPHGAAAPTPRSPHPPAHSLPPSKRSGHQGQEVLCSRLCRPHFSWFWVLNLAPSPELRFVVGAGVGQGQGRGWASAASGEAASPPKCYSGKANQTGRPGELSTTLCFVTGVLGKSFDPGASVFSSRKRNRRIKGFS